MFRSVWFDFGVFVASSVVWPCSNLHLWGKNATAENEPASTMVKGQKASRGRENQHTTRTFTHHANILFHTGQGHTEWRNPSFKIPYSYLFFFCNENRIIIESIPCNFFEARSYHQWGVAAPTQFVFVEFPRSALHKNESDVKTKKDWNYLIIVF